MITAVVWSDGLLDSTVAPVSLREMASRSELVFEGRVIGLEPVGPDGSSNIFTRMLIVSGPAWGASISWRSGPTTTRNSR